MTFSEANGNGEFREPRLWTNLPCFTCLQIYWIANLLSCIFGDRTLLRAHLNSDELDEEEFSINIKDYLLFESVCFDVLQYGDVEKASSPHRGRGKSISGGGGTYSYIRVVHH